MRENWKKTLLILRIVNFLSSAGMSMIVPFLSVYVVQLGVKNESEAILWAAMIFSANHLFISISSPFWGRLSDRIGPKAVMVPCGIGMAIVYSGMAFVTTPLHLLLLRCIFGMISGFGTAALALQSSITPKERAGEALGKLQSSRVAGSLIGPFFGGVFGESIGIRHTFLVTACALLISILVVAVAIKPVKVTKQRIRTVPSQNFIGVMQKTPLIVALYFSTFLVAAGIQTIEPILTLYIRNTMGIQHHVQMISGLIFSTSALGTVIAAPLLGKLGDKIGAHKILLMCLICGAAFYLPQPFVTSVILFSVFRFACGLAIGGLIPSINALLRSVTKRDNQGITFGFNQTAMSMGNVVGPLLGGVIDRQFGASDIFIGTSVLFVLNFVWVLITSKKAISHSHSKSSIAISK